VKKNKKGRFVIPRPFEEFGNFLAENREKAGLTQRAVSLALGYSSAQFISNFERGIVTPPLKKMKILIKLYGLDVADVIERLIAIESAKIREALK
jgi:transcriptional regulator with XRE-family HTH domain